MELLEGLVDSLTALAIVIAFAHASRLLWAGGLEEKLVVVLKRRADGAVLPATLLAVYVLSALLTNDGGLFLAMPLVVLVADVEDLDRTSVAVLASIAANAGSTLTPFGNPQNILVYLAHRPALHEWLIYASIASIVQLSGAPIAYRLGRRSAPRRVRGMVSGTSGGGAANAAGVIVAFLAALASITGNLPLALIATLAGFAACTIYRVDYPDAKLLSILAVLLTLPRLAAPILPLPVEGLEGYAAIVMYSQVLSNVPTAILAVEHNADWRLVLLAANVGGLGSVVASLANLVAVRLASADVREYHKVSLPAAAAAWAAGAALYALVILQG